MDDNHPMRRHFLDGADSYRAGHDLLNPWPTLSQEGQAYQAGWAWSQIMDLNRALHRDDAARAYEPR